MRSKHVSCSVNPQILDDWRKLFPCASLSKWLNAKMAEAVENEAL